MARLGVEQTAQAIEDEKMRTFAMSTKPILRERLTGRQLRLFAFRGAAHTLGVILWFFAMTRIPIAEVTAMNYLAPVYVTVGAALFLGERLALRRIVAVALALAGAAINRSPHRHPAFG